jgi:hypothetical protein
MESYIYYHPTHKFVIFEKINHHSKEMTLWDILKVEYGFTEQTITRPISNYDNLKKWLHLPIKTVKYKSFLCLEQTINDNEYTVYFDIWSVMLSKNGVSIFDKGKFENAELLQLLT